MLQMFEDAEAGRTIQRPQRKVNDEYDVIMNNILMMFLNNTYLNIQLKEKQYRQQNAELTALQLQIQPPLFVQHPANAGYGSPQAER